MTTVDGHDALRAALRATVSGTLAGLIPALWPWARRSQRVQWGELLLDAHDYCLTCPLEDDDTRPVRWWALMEDQR